MQLFQPMVNCVRNTLNIILANLCLNVVVNINKYYRTVNCTFIIVNLGLFIQWWKQNAKIWVFSIRHQNFQIYTEQCRSSWILLKLSSIAVNIKSAIIGHEPWDWVNRGLTTQSILLLSCKVLPITFCFLVKLRV